MSSDYAHLMTPPSKDTPQHNVIDTRYTPWDGTAPVYRPDGKTKIILEDATGAEFNFITPVVSVLMANINGAGVQSSSGKVQHMMRISKQPAPAWMIGAEALPYSQTATKEFWDGIEQVTRNCLMVAFQQPDMFQGATELAWERSPTKTEQEAFNIFLSKANLPYNDEAWTMRKNHMKGRGKNATNQYISIVDIANMEHTGNFAPTRGGLVSVCIRLWPYYMSEHVYGVSASFGDAGIKVYHTGGYIGPRLSWKKEHTCIVRSSQVDVYDIRGGPFQIKYLPKQFMELQELLQHFQEKNIQPAELGEEGYMLTAKVKVVDGNQLVWDIINKFKI